MAIDSKISSLGQSGSIFTNTTALVKPPTGSVIVAIQCLSDTTFNSLSPESGTGGICVGDDANEKGVGAEITIGGVVENKGSAGGQIINAGADSNLTIIPRGLTIYGRWESFSIDEDLDGGVIAYIGH